MRTDRAAAFVLAFVFLTLVVLLASMTRADPDLWGHLHFGQDVLASHQIPVRDTYSFTSDRPWINHEWLAEVAMAAAYRLCGVPGLVALSSGAVGFALLVVGVILNKARVGAAVVAIVLLDVIWGLGAQLLTVRPQLFSIVLFTVLLVLVNQAEAGRSRRLFLVAPVFALWANLHGGWVVGLGFLGMWALLAAVRKRLTWGMALGAPALALAASLLNPYGWGLWRFLWETVGFDRGDITEWQWILVAPSLLVPWAIAGCMIGLAWRRRGWDALPLVVPAAALGLAAFKVVRLDAWFVLSAAVMAGPLLGGVGRGRSSVSRLPTRAEWWAFCAIVAAPISVALYMAGRTANCVPVGGGLDSTPDREATAFVRANHLTGNIVTYFAYGEYVIWQFAPGLKVSYDGRRETVYSNTVIEANGRFYKGLDPGFARRIGADYVWLPLWLPVVKQLPREGWVPIFTGPRSVIFARTAGHYVAVAPLQGPRCFPGP